MATLRTRVSDRYRELALAYHRGTPTGELLAHMEADVKAAVDVYWPVPFAVGVVFLVVLAIGSPLFAFRARQTLGKEWSVTARLVEGHRLVTEGPYRIVRNPIYTGMFGMLLATGLAVSHWIGLAIAIVVFALGTFIRVRSEEKLLREMFGPEFDAYARKIPAVIPFLI